MGAGRTVFVFPGQGSQWVGMARGLSEASPVFRERLVECAAALSSYTDWSLLEVLDGEASLERVDVVQPALWAVMVSLAALWRSYGVVPDAVVGHSQGEIAAAVVAGALSLDDGARVVALRSQAITALGGRGGMVSVALSAEEVRSRLGRWSEDIDVAAVNGPTSTVVSGSAGALDELMAALEAEGVRARRVPVDYASHSAHVDGIGEEVLRLLAPVVPRSSEVAFYSTVSGGRIDTAELDASYWLRNLRRTVEFEATTRALLDDGHRVFVEVSPHPVLAIGLQETFEDASEGAAVVVPSLRRDEGGMERFLLSLGQAHVQGVSVDWSALFSGAQPVDLPTYPFQRQRYWLEATPDVGDISAAGLSAAEHPLLGAAVTLGGSDTVLLTGRLSLSGHPWLADHAVLGTVLLPGTGFVDLALHAARHTGLAVVDDLTLYEPLVVPEQGAVQVQITVEAPDPSGRRVLAVHARPEAPEGEQEVWTRHATGVLAAGPTPAPAPGDLSLWPPSGAVPVELADVYERLAGRGYEYGPVFQGLRALWRDDDDVLYAELELPDAIDPAGHVLHPALLDSALHPLLAVALADADAGADLPLLIPFSWSGVGLHHGAASPSACRVRLARTGEETATLSVSDVAGVPLAVVETLALRATDPGRLAALGSGRDPLRRVRWERAELTGVEGQFGGSAVVVGSDVMGLGREPGLADGAFPDVAALSAAVEGGRPVPDLVLVPCPSADGVGTAEAARAGTFRLLTLVQDWLADEHLAATTLAVVTSGAVLTPGDTDVIPAQAALWGLMRTVRSENPGRAVLIDTDGDPASSRALASALASGEPELALRKGELHLPGAAPVEADGTQPAFAPDPDGTILVTGGTGALGALIARHLVTEHGARHLLLASRGGPAAEGAAALTAELTALGATVTVAACDVAQRDAVAALLAGIPAEHPLTAVVHTAAVLDDGIVQALDQGRFETVWRPKVDGALHLHELTEELDLAAFVLFSSLAGVVGNAGQGNYASANVLLDALAQRRRALGLPGTSIAWGLWAESADAATGLATGLDAAGLARTGRGGLLPLDAASGLALFDAALATREPAVVAAGFDPVALRAQASAGVLAPQLRGLVRLPARRAAADPAARPFAERLMGLTEDERRRAVLELVRTAVAAVLGHGKPEQVADERSFKDLGFDSLTAVELRNRLSAATGLRLPATLVFDHPSTGALATFVLSSLAPPAATEGAPLLAELDRLEAALAVLGGDDTFRQTVSTRLQQLLSEWNGGATADATAQDTEDIASRIRDSSVSEIFDFIDTELGGIPQ
ncbi:MAG TPA: SDR family NAD(P)-dependent oxidoreductase [Streptomyces sp.]